MERMERRFQVGDVVRVIPAFKIFEARERNDESGLSDDPDHFCSVMRRLCGKRVRIVRESHPYYAVAEMSPSDELEGVDLWLYEWFPWYFDSLCWRPTTSFFPAASEEVKNLFEEE